MATDECLSPLAQYSPVPPGSRHPFPTPFLLEMVEWPTGLVFEWLRVGQTSISGSKTTKAAKAKAEAEAVECLYGKYKSNNGADINKQRM